MAPRRSSRPPLGQHFLRSQRIVDQILAALPDDDLPILEVGAGQGVLTEPLADLERPLVAVEYDASLARVLQHQLREREQVAVVEHDILTIDATEALARVAASPPFGLIGNLPYAITAPLFRRFLSLPRQRPAWMIVMVQREVADQLVAPTGKRSLLSVSVQLYAEPEVLFYVDREAFDPPPKVRSAVCRINMREGLSVDLPSEDRFFEVVRAGFRAPRKQLHNSLAMGLWLETGGAKEWLEQCEIDPMRRAATLTLDEWAALSWARERSGEPEAPDHRMGMT